MNERLAHERLSACSLIRSKPTLTSRFLQITRSLENALECTGERQTYEANFAVKYFDEKMHRVNQSQRKQSRKGQSPPL